MSLHTNAAFTKALDASHKDALDALAAFEARDREIAGKCASMGGQTRLAPACCP